MAADNELQVKITSDITGIKTGTQEAASVFSRATEQIQSSVSTMNSNVSSAMSNVTSTFSSAFSTIGAAAASFGSAIVAYLSVSALKGAIDAALSYRDSVEQLSRVMGITSEQASVLNVALKMVGVSAESYATANIRLAMHVKTSEGALNQLGVATRDTSGNLLSQTAIFNNAVAAMQQYKAGADQNQFALYAFGRNAQSIYEIMRLNNRVMAEAEQVAKSYGLILTSQASETMERYREKLAVITLLFDAIKMKIGTELLPELVKMSGWFASEGPKAISIFTGAAKGFIMVADGVITEVQNIVTVFVAWGKIIGDVFTGQWKKAVLDFKAGAAEIDANVAHLNLRMSELFAKTAPEKMLGGAGAGAPAGPAAGGKSFVTPETPSDLLAKWKDELKQREISEQAFFGLSKEEEKAFWESKLATIKGAGKDQVKLRLEVNSEIFGVEKTGAKEALETTINALKQQQESEKLTGAQRIAIQDQILSAIQAAGARETSIYRSAALEREKLVEQEAVKEIKEQEKILEAHLQTATIAIEAKMKEVNTAYELGSISATKQLEQLRTLLTEKYNLELQTFNRIRALWEQYPVQWQAVEKKIELATAKHEADMKSVENKATLEMQKTWTKAFDAIASSLNINWAGVIEGTQNLRDQMTSIGENIASTMINAWARMCLEQIAYELTAATASKALTKETALSKIASSASSAAAGAYDAFASIPYVGPVLGAIAAAVVFAAVMAFGASVGSAAGGWDVDKDSLGMVHAKEMVLPAPLAEGIRGMIAGQGTVGGPSQQRAPIINVTAMDGTDVKRVLSRHAPTIYNTLRLRGRPYGIR